MADRVVLERCERTELLQRDCAHCRGLPDLVPAAKATRRGDGAWGPFFRAQFPGRCSYCDTPFAVGDRIRADGEGGFLAECCGEDD